VGKPEGKNPLGRPRHRWEVGGIAWGGKDWIDMAQDREKWRTLVSTVLELEVP
jgi:hypothetical protein